MQGQADNSQKKNSHTTVKNISKQQLFTRRAVLMMGAMTLPFVVMLGRIVGLQWFAGHKYKKLAEDNRISLRPVLAPRGRLLDRNRQVVAYNEKAFRLLIIPEQKEQLPATFKRLERLIGLTPHEQKKAMTQLRTAPSYIPIVVRANLSYEELVKVQVNLPELPGIDVDEGLIRHYPQDDMSSHILGYVGPPTRDQAEKSHDPFYKNPDAQVGKEGVEKLADGPLRGEAGRRELEVNAYGRAVREVAYNPPLHGQDIPLSIDINLQKMAYDLLGDSVGSVVAIDTLTGELLVALSKPAYNGNAFSGGVPTDVWQSLMADPKKPLLNRITQGIYAPGSTYKALVALAALEEGWMRPNEQIYCDGSIVLGNRRFHCWKPEGHGSVDMHRGLVKSCDVYFYQLAKQMDPDALARYAHMFGLGHKTTLGLPEQPGLIPTHAIKRARQHEAWQGGDSLITAVGQGLNLVTPLQLAVMAARLASGAAVVPTLFQPGSPPIFDMLPVKRSHLDFIHQALFDTIEGGTGFGARRAGVALGGKTGTAQVLSKNHGDVKSYSGIVREERPHAMFIGFGPIPSPRVAISVVVEHGGYGGTVAAPIGTKVMEAALKSLGVIA